MTNHHQTSSESGATRRAVPLTAATEARVGHHRMVLAMTVVVLTACLILPTPDSAGDVQLPGLDISLPTFCMLKRECGIDCPGCGLTRCFISMGHGQLVSAWGYHPIGTLLFVLLVAQIPYRLCQIRRLHRGRREFGQRMFVPLLCLLVLAILGQWILRLTGVCC